MLGYGEYLFVCGSMNSKAGISGDAHPTGDLKNSHQFVPRLWLPWHRKIPPTEKKTLFSGLETVWVNTCFVFSIRYSQHSFPPRYAVVDAGDARNDPFDQNMLDSTSVEGDAFGDAMLRQWLIENLTP